MDNNMIASKPLTNEEVSVYVAAALFKFQEGLSTFSNEMKEQNKVLLEIRNSIEKMTLESSGTAAVVREMTNKIDKQGSRFLAAINGIGKEPIENTEPKLKNTAGEAECTKWATDARKSLEIIGRKTKRTYLQMVYELNSRLVASNEDIFGMFGKYKSKHPNSRMIGMYAHSDYYRPLVEKYIKEMYVEYLPERYSLANMVDENKQRLTTTVTMRCPKEVSSIVEDYAKRKGITYMSATYRLYHNLYKKLGTTLRDEIKTYCNQIGVKNCSPAYFISKNNKYLSMFKDIAEE